MLRVCTILTLLRAAAGDPTSEAEAQALVKLTHLFKKDPAAAEQLVQAAKRSAPAPASPTPYEELLASVKSTAASPPPPAAQPGAFTWATAQQNMRSCMNGTTPVPRQDRYAYWRSTSALGNALNGWMHVFLYALASGRQLVAGDGLAVELLCGTHGAFICGIPYRSRSWLKQQSSRGVDAGWTDSDHAVHTADLMWFKYSGVSTAIMRGAQGVKSRRRWLLRCYAEALRCPEGGERLSGGREECLMARAMQLLLPGSRLRPEFVHAALVEAKRRWLGSIEEFERVVATRRDVIGDHIFYDPPLQGDATTRWEGALHVRGMPNALEGGHDGGTFRQFHANLANGSASNTWPCVAQRARAFDKQHTIQDAPRSFYLATDMKGLCRDAKRALERHDSSLTIVCLDAAPVHLTKSKHAPVSVDSDDGLDGHQAVVLDWYLLTRSRWLAPIVRKGTRCHGPGRGASTTGRLYDVGQPGQSFFGWALAAAGLGPAPPKQLPCNCGLDRRRVSVFGRPRWTPVPVAGSDAPAATAASVNAGTPAGNAIDGAIGQALVAGADAAAERRTRKMCPFSAHGQDFMSAHDRSSAHFAAWHSPKRDPQVWGEHFKLDDCRVWMRLHFWAARETGLFAEHPAFMDYYVRFIGHFVSVYERLAPPFARESARWSESPANVEAYLATKQMPDVVGVSPREALQQLPAAERAYTGSSASRPLWPYA